MQERIDDYVAFGIPNVWIFDPSRKKAHTADTNGVHRVMGDTLEAIGVAVRIDLPVLWPDSPEEQI